MTGGRPRKQAEDRYGSEKSADHSAATSIACADIVYTDNAPPAVVDSAIVDII